MFDSPSIRAEMAELARYASARESTTSRKGTITFVPSISK